MIRSERQVLQDASDGSLRQGNVEMAQFLISMKADVNARDNFFWTPLHFACNAGQLPIVQMLVDSGANMNAVTMHKATPLMRAVETSRIEIVEYLLEKGMRSSPNTFYGVAAYQFIHFSFEIGCFIFSYRRFTDSARLVSEVHGQLEINCNLLNCCNTLILTFGRRLVLAKRCQYFSHSTVHACHEVLADRKLAWYLEIAEQMEKCHEE